MASATYLIRNIFMIGITVYVPCTAITAVVDIDYIWLTMAMAVMILIFTILVSLKYLKTTSYLLCHFSQQAGLKASVVSDAIQVPIMIVISMLIVFHGMYKSGGIAKPFKISSDDGNA